MSKSKHFTAILLAIFFIIPVMLSSCNTTTIDQSSNSSDLKPVELTWYLIGSESDTNSPEHEAINKIVESKINATVNFVTLGYSSFNQTMNVKLASGEYFDLCFTSNWNNDYFRNVSQNAYMNLDTLLPKYAPKTYKQVPSYIWDGVKVNNKLYAVINYQITARQEGFWMKKDLVQKYKFDTSKVKSYKDLVPFLQTIKENEKGVTPAQIKFDGMWQFVNKGYGFDKILGPAYINFSDKTGKIVNVYETTEYQDLCQNMSDWYKKGYIPSDAQLNYDPGKDIEAGKFACGNTGTLKPGDEEEFKLSHGFEVTDVAFSEPLLNTTGCISSLTAISAKSKNPERALMLIDLINSDKVLYANICYGTEGTNWSKSKTNPNKIDITEGNDYWKLDWEVASIFNSYIDSLKPDNVLERTKQINENAKRSVALGFNFNPTPIKTEFASCESVIREFTPSLELGSSGDKWKTKYSQFTEKLKIAGVDKIITEVQKQYNEWKVVVKK